MSSLPKEQVFRNLLAQSGDPPVVLAPMAEVNDLPFRLLCRKHNVKLCWTGMVNTVIWTTMPNCRENLFQTCPEDRPLVIQLAGHELDQLIQTALDLEPHCDAIDINLGCTQHIACRGGYGHFMVNSEKKRTDTIEIIRGLSAALTVPLSVKIRPVDNEDGEPDPVLTANFARALEAAGASLISIHGRQKSQNKAGDVNYQIIKSIVDAVQIPVLANGGVSCKEDIFTIMEQTGADGVMVGQGLLINPLMFDPDPTSNPVAVGREYISLFTTGDFFPARRHFFYAFREQVKVNGDIEKRLKSCHNMADLSSFLDDFEAGQYPCA